MKVLNRRKYEETIFPLRHCCENCRSELEVEESDVKRGYLGQAYIECPVCGGRSYLEDDRLDVKVTKDNVIFPDDFYHFKTKDTSPELDTDNIREYIDDAINYFRDNPDSFCYYTGSGDLAVVVLNYSGDETYDVTVCKGFYETEIGYDEFDCALHIDDDDCDWKNKGVKRVR